MLSPDRLIAVVSVALPLGAWGVVAREYAVNGGGGYSSVAGDFVLLAVLLTLGTLALVVQAWRGKLSSLWPVLLAVLATPAILFLGAIINLRG